MPIEKASVFEVYLLEKPLPLTIAIAVVGFAIFIIGNSRAHKKKQITGLVVLSVAAIIFLAATAITTKREQIKSATKQFIAIASSEQYAGSRRYFSPSAVLTGPDGNVRYKLDAILQNLGYVHQRWSVRRYKIRQLEADSPQDKQGRSYLHVQNVVAGRAAETEWLLKWKQNGSAWVITEIQWMSFNDKSPPTTW